MSNGTTERQTRRERRASYVQFTEEEYNRVLRLQEVTGHSIPWLLKTALLSRDMAPPLLDPDSRRAALRELRYIGNNINQIARQANAGIVSGIQREIAEIHAIFKTLRSFLSRDYGDPAGSTVPKGAASR